MKLGVNLRNMGPQSDPAILRDGVLAAEAAGFESIWITDHIAIPPDDAEGSGGRYTDPLTTLAWLAGLTSRIKLGVGVLIVPYRPALPVAKQIATLQELSGNRLLLGCAVGWMDAEFRALGVDRHQRGALTDDALSLWADCFSNDVVEHNGQPFIFAPRPAPPPIYVGGSARFALPRAVRFDHGWLPMARDMDRLATDMAEFDRQADAAGKSRGPVTVMTGLSEATIERCAELGVERIVAGGKYGTIADYRALLAQLASIGQQLL